MDAFIRPDSEIRNNMNRFVFVIFNCNVTLHCVVKLTGICIYIYFIEEIDITYKRWGSRIVAILLCLVIDDVSVIIVGWLSAASTTVS